MTVVYKFKALTDIWTGSVDGKSDRCISTGLIGSIRWWYEVLIRGLGGYACDPSNTKCDDKKHCVVCELFGCTGWSRKFRFEVLDEKAEVQSAEITGNKKFTFRFTELRLICNEEWALLDATLRLISEYGAIGGKTVLKPSDENNRNQHKDYGLIQIEKAPSVEKMCIGKLKAYLEKNKFESFADKDFDWASLKHFWFVNGKSLSRQDSNNSAYNQVLGRKESKSQAQQIDNNTINQWLAGKQQESKKVFSFKNPPRTFGFVNPGVIDFPVMKERLRKVWPDLKDEQFIEGTALINELFGKEQNI